MIFLKICDKIPLSYDKEGIILSLRERTLRYILLVVGVFFIALGIAAAKHSNLGISPISSIANIMSIKFPTLTVGTWLMLSNCLMILIQIILLRTKFKPIQFLQFPISLILGIFTDLCLNLVSFIPANIYIVRLLLVFISVFVLAFGITLTIISDTVMNVGEAFVDVISKLMGKNFGSVKVVVDITFVAISVILSLLFFDFKILGTREGTIITATLTGFVIKWLTKHIKSPILKAITKN